MQERGVRRFQTKRVITHRVRQWHVAIGIGWEELRKEAGRFAKRSPFDCGCPGCSLCHPHRAEPTGPYYLRRVDRVNRIVDAELPELIKEAVEDTGIRRIAWTRLP